MVRIRRFGVMKTATVVAVMTMVSVAIFVVPFVLIGGALLARAAGATASSGALVFGFIAIFVYGAISWVGTAIACLLYNLVAGFTGGIEVQLEGVAPPPPAPVWGTPTGPCATSPTSPWGPSSTQPGG